MRHGARAGQCYHGFPTIFDAYLLCAPDATPTARKALTRTFRLQRGRQRSVDARRLESVFIASFLPCFGHAAIFTLFRCSKDAIFTTELPLVLLEGHYSYELVKMLYAAHVSTPAPFRASRPKEGGRC